ncbi:hypothetical protein RA27_22030 [Ruegeria sp. ANG-R]|uniref:hypothetical protein n=1 Tax=Ruegeria sp. ANG-R TaxID=1577903 RepID=UPI00057C5064|nr:hypothetical protein [Ruegeria sp. ANG-R]KIC36654.1 hypothetical protein RA27_22030 [Ruegeria sp. ANG-R]
MNDKSHYEFDLRIIRMEEACAVLLETVNAIKTLMIEFHDRGDRASLKLAMDIVEVNSNIECKTLSSFNANKMNFQKVIADYPQVCKLMPYTVSFFGTSSASHPSEPNEDVENDIDAEVPSVSGS